MKSPRNTTRSGAHSARSRWAAYHPVSKCWHDGGGQPQLDGLAGGRDASGRAGVNAGTEAEPRRRRDVDVDVDAVGVGGERGDPPAAGDRGERLVGGDLPLDVDLVRQSVADEPGPQHGRALVGVARRDAQGERVGLGRRCRRAGRGRVRRRRRRWSSARRRRSSWAASAPAPSSGCAVRPRRTAPTTTVAPRARNDRRESSSGRPTASMSTIRRVGDITRVGVVGGGLMGSGIAEVCGRAGLDVIVREVDAGAAEAAHASGHQLARPGACAPASSTRPTATPRSAASTSRPTTTSWPIVSSSSRRSSSGRTSRSTCSRRSMPS